MQIYLAIFSRHFHTIHLLTDTIILLGKVIPIETDQILNKF
jgi:hypothetical protein